MAHCIYSGADGQTASFDTAEHIFPKCIGGVRCLPKGWFSDAVNNSFSKLELGFARSNPEIVLNRMFFAKTGRKTHKNREHIGVFKNKSDSSDYALGYIKDATPVPLQQLIVETDFSLANNQPVPVRIVLAPSDTETYEAQLQTLWMKLRSYTGSPHCIKDKRISPHTYLLGYKDQRWFLGISEKENPESIKPRLQNLIKKISSEDVKSVLSGNGSIVSEQHQVEVSFRFEGNYFDFLRVYAKIAVNCLAALKGRPLLESSAFDNIKRAILTGENIEEYVWKKEGPRPVSDALRIAPERLSLGDRCHATAFFQEEGWIYSAISLYGMDNPIIVKLGMIESHVETDFYICDWENHVDYTLTECVLKMCKHDEALSAACYEVF